MGSHLAEVPKVEDGEEKPEAVGPETGAETLGEGAVETAETAAPPEKPDPGPKLLQEALPGDWATISADFGGDAPTVAEIRLLGGSMPIEGSFAKGTEIDLLIRVRVSEVHGVDVLDGWGNAKRTIRRHRARLISVRRFGN